MPWSILLVDYSKTNFYPKENSQKNQKVPISNPIIARRILRAFRKQLFRKKDPITRHKMPCPTRQKFNTKRKHIPIPARNPAKVRVMATSSSNSSEKK